MIKSTAKISTAKPFPKLMVSKGGKVVLMLRHSQGICVVGDDHKTAGTYKTDWCMYSLVDYEGEVTISNG